MIFQETKLSGVFEIELEPKADDRGFFARSWCRNEFEAKGLNASLLQCSISFNTLSGTLRGMHYQVAPYQETKLIRCTSGSLYDVVLDLRPDSPTYREWIGFYLTASNRRMVYVPKGCAHGFLTLEDGTEILYQISEVYNAASARGVRWDDPAFGISWPRTVEVISERDRTYQNVES